MDASEHGASELLAPAGNFEKLRYALAYGADAVYAGQPQFSLRARENGFKSLEDVEEAVRYTQQRGKKFYLTSNIIPHNNKIKAFQKSLGEYAELGPDAFIVSEPGIVAFLAKNFPQVEIHLSVQANCTNWLTAQFWKDQGVRRIILSRELNLREIGEIHRQVPGLELETFVHGAICMAYSGRCLLSNYMSYRDGNQGMCSNACRNKFQLYAGNEPQSENYTPLEGSFYLRQEGGNDWDLMPVDEDDYGTYIMNSKDMCAIEHLQALQEAGVVSFKIEGRTKSLYYLSQVVRSYRGAIDDLTAGRPWNPRHREEIDKLDSRGYIPGFFIPQRSLPQNYDSTRERSLSARVAGVIRKWDAVNGEAVVSVKSNILEGDRLELATPDGSELIEAKSLKNHKGFPVDKLTSGLENCRISLKSDPGPFALLIAVLPKQRNSVGEPFLLESR